MQYNLKGTTVDITDEIRSYLDKKLSGLDELLHQEAARTDVELEYLASEEKMYRAELMLHNGAIWRATARAGTLHEAIDKAVAELFSELTRAKKQKRGTFRRNAARAKEFIRGWRRDI